ncbi:MAG: hypothetical protein Q4C95_09420 [Planctomycetia bacterium]|nr:hypothetical protein [Planctomycetia bacterium]
MTGDLCKGEAWRPTGFDIIKNPMKEESKIGNKSASLKIDFVKFLFKGVDRTIFVLLWFFSLILILERFLIEIPNSNLGFLNFFFLTVFICFWTNIGLFFYYISTVCCEYPFWLDESISTNKHLLRTFPAWLTGIFFVLPLFPIYCSFAYFIILVAHSLFWRFERPILESKIRYWRQNIIKRACFSHLKSVSSDFAVCDSEFQKSGLTEFCFSGKTPNINHKGQSENQININNCSDPLRDSSCALKTSQVENNSVIDNDQSVKKKLLVENKDDSINPESAAKKNVVADSEILNDIEGHLTQWQRRSILPNVSDQIEGSIFVPFIENEETTTVHLSFCPPFEHIPHFEAEIENENSEIKLIQIFPYGVRLEIKRILPVFHSEKESAVHFNIDSTNKKEMANSSDNGVQLCYFASCPLDYADAGKVSAPDQIKRHSVKK